MIMSRKLVVFGLGYSAYATAQHLSDAGWTVFGTRRIAEHRHASIHEIAFDDAESCLKDATHLLVSVPPGADGDPALGAYADAIRRAPTLKWIGYFSTTGVYGDHQGARVDETTPPAPTQPRSILRLEAERAWASLAAKRRIACDVIRLGGIYGPGRSAFDTLRAGTARAIVAPAHRFSRIHVTDIAQGVAAAIATSDGGARIFNFVDDTPAPQSDVIFEAARLLGIEAPKPVPLAQAWADMSPMARSFWSERRIVDSRGTSSVLGRPWCYPSYREGLRAILDEETAGRQDGSVRTDRL